MSTPRFARFSLLPPIVTALLVGALMLAPACTGDGGGGETPATATAAPDGAGAPRIAGEDGLTTIEIARKLAPSIVRVQTESASLDAFGRLVPSQGIGTGVIIDTEGHIVTNNHVVTANGNQPADRITVTLSDQRTLPAEIVGRDQATDLAVLKIDAQDLTPAEFGDPGELVVGQEVVAIGFALGLEGEPTVTRGVLSAKDRTIEEDPYTIPDAIQTDAGINPGNSGGPLVNARGEVIGINTAIISGAQNIGFSISVGLVRPTVEALIESGRIERAYLGVGTVDVTASIARNFELPVESGIAVTLVGEGSPAARAGLRQNDVIVAIDGEQIDNNGELLALLAARKSGDTVTVEYYRGSEHRSVDVTLGERPEG